MDTNDSKDRHVNPIPQKILNNIKISLRGIPDSEDALKNCVGYNEDNESDIVACKNCRSFEEGLGNLCRRFGFGVNPNATCVAMLANDPPCTAVNVKTDARDMETRMRCIAEAIEDGSANNGYVITKLASLFDLIVRFIHKHPRLKEITGVDEYAAIKRELNYVDLPVCACCRRFDSGSLGCSFGFEVKPHSSCDRHDPVE